MRTARAWLLAGALVAGGLGVPAPAAGAVAALQDDHLAIVGPEAVQGRIDLIASTGTRATRVDVLWSQVAPARPTRAADPADPAYTWARVDATFTGLAARGITPIVSVFSPPTWATGGRRVAGEIINPHEPDAAAFGAFMRALATRYSGRYVPAGAAAPLPAVVHFEIWNEPNLARTFRPRRGGALAGYLRLVRAATPAVRAANRRAVVIAGAAGPAGSARPWLHGLVRARGVTFDAISQHIYPAAPPRKRTRTFPSWTSLGEILRIIDSRPATRGKPLYITEAGYTTAPTPFRTVRVSFDKQALYLAQIFGLPLVRGPRIPVVVWFNLQDNPNWPGGLLRENGVAKPSLATFKGVARRPLTAVHRRALAGR
jgi:hypothetical protein